MKILKSFFLCLVSVWTFANNIFSFESKQESDVSLTQESIIKAIKDLNIELCYIYIIKHGINLNNIMIDQDVSAFGYIFNKIVNKLFILLDKKTPSKILRREEINIAALIRFSSEIKKIYGDTIPLQISIPHIYFEKIFNLALKTAKALKKRVKRKDKENLIYNFPRPI